MEDVGNYLLGHKDTADLVRARGGKGKVLMIMFDETSEELVKELGLEMALPPAKLRTHIDSKIVTTQLGNDAGVPSVPNALGRAKDFAELRALAEKHGLGDHLVVQTPYGDSGRTTFFIKTQADWDKYAERMADEDLKVMRYVNHMPGTVEGCATRHGTLVGPIMTDITGFAEVTPYKGGWCGNDASPARPAAGRAGPGARHGAAARRPAVAGGLQGRLLLRLPDRYRHRRRLSRRDQPAHQRRLAADQPDHHDLWRLPAVPVPPARVHGRRLGARPRPGPVTLGRLRHLEPADPQADRGQGRADHRSTAPRASGA